MPEGQDIWSYLLASHDPKTGKKFTHEELVSEASLFIIGGTDGMITAATATLFYLLHDRQVLDQLTSELRQAFPPSGGPAEAVQNGLCPIRFASPELARIQLLSACIDEAMRLSPPVPSILPRTIGPGGMVIDGEFFPEGLDIGIPHYSLQRDPDYFQEPLAYKPRRWLMTDYESNKPEPRSRSKLIPGVGQAPSFTPFGAGRSSCIGKFMAYQEISYILARLMWHFDMKLDPQQAHIGEGTGTGQEGRERKNEFQLYCRFVSQQYGPVILFRKRKLEGL
ncbi:hypothetical protein JX265_009969 [Neoarthrinium moseri]|uniref:Cytochrome P450 n=1 Tax=Neoarthrinium moseri TaxID=1658444 RepID=A0A9Q0AKY0_9PEZI|nr:hypothetical protein JX265_009969 [Neoarthrinium moseri]